MFSEFKDFYGLSKDQYNELWDECIFVFDTNVLLNLYRYSDSTRVELLKIIEKFKERIWLPHQVGLEFHLNRATVIQSQIDSYERITNLIKKKSAEIINELNEELKDYKKRHPRIDIVKTLESIETSFSLLVDDIGSLGRDHPDYLADDDDILNRLGSIFKHKVGERYEQKKLDEIFKDGEKRYKFEIPPGYKDLKEKKGQKRYYDGIYISSEFGDLIVWNQIIDLALFHKKPVIFITDDAKKDWWEIVRGRTVRPRVELINEFRNKTDKLFYMYKTDRFMDFAKDYLHQEISPDAIQEVKDYREARKESTYPDNIYRILYEEKFPYLIEEDWEEYQNKLEVGVSETELMNWAKNQNHLRSIQSDNIQTEYEIGDLVKHSKWGLGAVVSCRITKGHEEIDVEFDSVGTKRLLAKFAPLDKIIFQ